MIFLNSDEYLTGWQLILLYVLNNAWAHRRTYLRNSLTYLMMMNEFTERKRKRCVIKRQYPKHMKKYICICVFVAFFALLCRSFLPSFVFLFAFSFLFLYLFLSSPLSLPAFLSLSFSAVLSLFLHVDTRFALVWDIFTHSTGRNNLTFLRSLGIFHLISAISLNFSDKEFCSYKKLTQLLQTRTLLKLQRVDRKKPNPSDCKTNQRDFSFKKKWRFKKLCKK